MEYKCSVCSQEVGKDLLNYVNHTQEHILDEIKAANPDWIEGDGVCQKCYDYFKSQMKGESA